MNASFTIGRFMIAVAIMALGLAIFRFVGPVALFLFGLMSFLYGCWFVSRTWPFIAPWLMLVIALAGIFPGVGLTIWTYEFVMPVLVSLLAIFTSLCCLTIGLPWIRSRRGHVRPSVAQAGSMVALASGFSLSLIAPWPLLLAFWVSRSSLERLANRVAVAGSMSGPEHAGFFEIQGARVDSLGNVALLLDTNPNGPRGFVWYRREFTKPLVYPTDHFVPLTWSWSYVSED